MFSSWDEWRLMGAVLSIITKSVSYHTGCVHAKDICFIIGLQRLCAALIVWTRVNSRNAATEWWQHHKHCPGIIIIIIIIINKVGIRRSVWADFKLHSERRKRIAKAMEHETGTGVRKKKVRYTIIWCGRSDEFFSKNECSSANGISLTTLYMLIRCVWKRQDARWQEGWGLGF